MKMISRHFFIRYFPSPPSTETDQSTSSGSAQPIHSTTQTSQQQHLLNHRQQGHIDHDSDAELSMGTSGYPEYKH